MAGEFYMSDVSNTGFDYMSYLQKYRELKLIPVEMMAQQVIEYQQKDEIIGSIKGKLSELLSPAIDLTLNSTYETKKAKLSNSDIASVDVTNDAVETTYSVTVNSLAQANKFKVGTINPITDIDSKLTSTGSLVINYLKDGTAKSLTVDYTNKSLREIMDQINQSGDLQASIINIGSSNSPDYQLVISSKNTGTQNRITGIDDTTNPGDDSAGIFSKDITKTYETVSASDAEIVVDGVTFTRQSNTFSNIITGVTITVKDLGSTNITIDHDYSKIKDSIQVILDNYNQLKETIRLATSKGQPLQGETSLNSIAAGVFNILTSYLGKYGILDTIGGADTTRGLLQLNEEAFNNFTNLNNAKDILQELGRSLETYVNTYTDTLTITSQRYTERIKNMQERIDYMTSTIDKQIENMRMRFAQLDIYLSEMQALQNRLEIFASGLLTTNNE